MDSNMNNPLQVVAVLHILSGVLGLIAAVVIFAVFGVAGGIVISQGEPEQPQSSESSLC
jgi:hypothetical protein